MLQVNFLGMTAQEEGKEQKDISEPSVLGIMVQDVPVVDVDENVKNAASMMEQKEYGCLIVVDEGVAIGIVTESDIVLKVTAEGVDPTKVLIQDIMSTPIIDILSDATISDVAVKMSTFKVRKLVVTDENGKLLGLVTSIDLAKWLSAQKNYTDETLNALAKLGPREGGPYT
jgi:CBS domain-containing protein